MTAVEMENVSKRFRRQTVQPATSLKTAFVDFLLHRRRRERDSILQALQGITLTIEQGRTLGIIGRNGSGKSTLLKLLAGIYRPDSGRVMVRGKVGALLELGAGFHPEFSGRENVLINGIVLGLSKREVRRRFAAIVRFAELEASIDEPVKTYSLGMYARLGFAVAVHADPDILLIDEVLAVGDEAFQQKCYDKIADFQRDGKTIILVNHALAEVEQWSHEVLWLEDGIIRAHGHPRRVIELYRQGVAVQRGEALDAQVGRVSDLDREPASGGEPCRWGNRHIEITGVRMLDYSGAERYVYQSGELSRVVFQYKVHRRVADTVFGIGIVRADGICCYGSNTAIEGIVLPALGEEGAVEVLLERLDFIPGSYYLDVAVHAKDGSPYDFHHRLYAFTVHSELHDVGVCRLPHRWTIKPSLSMPVL